VIDSLVVILTIPFPDQVGTTWIIMQQNTPVEYLASSKAA